jgi:hypothetical protein
MIHVVVRQFECGNQGSLRYKEMIDRRLHSSTVAYPEFNGCCSCLILPQTLHWVRYKNQRWQVNFEDDQWELRLPGVDQ